jgi:hypothetical protein
LWQNNTQKMPNSRFKHGDYKMKIWFSKKKIIRIIHLKRNWTPSPKPFVVCNGNVLHPKPPNHAPTHCPRKINKQNKPQGYIPPRTLHQAWRLKLLQPLKFRVQVHCSQPQCTLHTTPKYIILHHVKKKNS